MKTIKITFPFAVQGITPDALARLFAAAQITIQIASVSAEGNVVTLTADRALTEQEITVAGAVFRAAYPRIENVE